MMERKLRKESLEMLDLGRIGDIEGPFPHYYVYHIGYNGAIISAMSLDGGYCVQITHKDPKTGRRAELAARRAKPVGKHDTRLGSYFSAQKEMLEIANRFLRVYAKKHPPKR